MKLRGEKGVVLCYFGDGATSEGDFYEGCNLAGVLDLPVIFLCCNNAWAISTPVHWQTAAASFADKAAAFGFPGELVDGTDARAVYEATDRARKRATSGGGPSLIEARCYRLGPHTTADDPARYVPKEELEEARRRDPIDLLRNQLVEQGDWNEALEEAARVRANDLMDRAIAEAEAVKIRAEALFDHLYERPTPRMEGQRRRLLEELEARKSR